MTLGTRKPKDISHLSSCETSSPEFDQKSLEKLIDHIFATTEMQDRVSFYGWLLSDQSHVQHHQELALARAAGVTPQTAFNWIKGNTQCPMAGKLYAKCRARFSSETEMAQAFGAFINRDLIAEVSG